MKSSIENSDSRIFVNTVHPSFSTIPNSSRRHDYSSHSNRVGLQEQCFSPLISLSCCCYCCCLVVVFVVVVVVVVFVFFCFLFVCFCFVFLLFFFYITHGRHWSKKKITINTLKKTFERQVIVYSYFL